MLYQSYFSYISINSQRLKWSALYVSNCFKVSAQIHYYTVLTTSCKGRYSYNSIFQIEQLNTGAMTNFSHVTYL
jgi:hypothetical protein